LEEALDQKAFFVDVRIVLPAAPRSASSRRDDGHTSSRLEACDEYIGVVPFVGKDIRIVYEAKKFSGLGDVVNLAFG
jgi:hypothetical protein